MESVSWPLFHNSPLEASCDGGELHAEFTGKMLSRGMWLYPWRVDTPQGEMLYVGHTGDSSSLHATAPYTRMKVA